MRCPWCLRPIYSANHCDHLSWLFGWAAQKTWHDLRDSQRFRIGMSEDSITETLLLEMHRRTSQLACIRYTRRQERQSGADWLWWFVSEDRGFPILIQAKRQYPSGRYEALTYSCSATRNQIITLLQTARYNGWLPLYCFYNFRTLFQYNPLFGCTVAWAPSVENHLKFSSSGNSGFGIGPMSIPWMHLVCPRADSESKGSFPDVVRRRAQDLPGIDTIPKITNELPSVVRNLIRVNDSIYYEQPLDLPESLAGIVVVSDQPIVGID